MLMSKHQRLFCSKPFEWFEVTQLNGRGGVYLCCPSWLDTSVGNLQYQSVEEIWNGEKAQAIRRSILDGSFSYCNASKCPYLQTESGPVQTIDQVEEDYLRAVIQNRQTVVPYGPKKVICTYDQSCNLSCPSCRTELVIETDKKQEILNLQNKLEAQALRDAELLLITGSGDPFGSPFFRKWLQTMNKQDMPNLKRIHLHTNGLLWTPHMWATISEDVQRLIRSCEISIDAAGAETYAINRRGGNFARLMENLEFISSLRRRGPLEYVKISMVVQENNFREMPDFVSLGKRFGFQVAYFSQLVNWGTFSDEEFRTRAVHLRTHAAHEEFLLLLQNDVFDDPVVDLGNLTAIKNSSAVHAKDRLAHSTAGVLKKIRAHYHPGLRRRHK